MFLLFSVTIEILVLWRPYIIVYRDFNIENMVKENIRTFVIHYLRLTFKK